MSKCKCNNTDLTFEVKYLNSKLANCEDLQLKAISVGDGIDTRVCSVYADTPIGRVSLKWGEATLRDSSTPVEILYLRKGARYLVGLGFCAKIPKGFKAWNLLRSSTADKYKIRQTNSLGLIDSSYCGNTDEWLIPIIADEDTYLVRYERFGQFALSQVYMPVIKKVDNLTDKSRGGFGEGTSHIK